MTNFTSTDGGKRCFLELRCGPKKSHPGITLEKILPNKPSDYLERQCDSNRGVGAQKASEGTVSTRQLARSWCWQPEVPGLLRSQQ